jgi:hypothetical protein
MSAIIVLPIYVAIAGVVAALAIAIGTVPCLYYGFAYIVRVIYNVTIA